MARYIDADKLHIQMEELYEHHIEMKNFSADGAVADCLDMLDNTPTADVVEMPDGGIGNLSDGYHTFNELYHHRAVLFSVICNSMPDKAWKSKLHDSGDMYDGMFIVGIETPDGHATYHFYINPYWGMFRVPELERAPEWDGHTPEDAINRIASLRHRVDVDEVKHGFWIKNGNMKTCSVCGFFYHSNNNEWIGCPICLSKMDGGEK